MILVVQVLTPLMKTISSCANFTTQRHNNLPIASALQRRHDLVLLELRLQIVQREPSLALLPIFLLYALARNYQPVLFGIDVRYRKVVASVEKVVRRDIVVR